LRWPERWFLSGVVVLSKKSIMKEWPMRELRILMHRHKKNAVKLVALLHFENFDQFKSCVEHCSENCKEILRSMQDVTLIRMDQVRDCREQH
jgi:hypothetical protein